LWNALLLRATLHLKSNEFNEREVSNLLWAYAKADKDKTHPRLLDALANKARLRIDYFNPQNLATTAWAFATLNHETPSLFDAIARSAQERINDFSPQDFANTAWAFAVFNIDTNSAVTDADSQFAQTLLSTDPTFFSVEALFQVHQYHLWCRERNTSSSWFSDEFELSFVWTHLCQETTKLLDYRTTW
jgi:hypothetical protein